MNEWILISGLTTLLATSALFVAVYAMFRAQRASHEAARAVEEAREESAAAIETMRSRLESVAAELQESPRRAAVEPLPGAPKASMNLSRRSQALRLRRGGESPEKIAEKLEMPRQEVELLIKVQEIVLNHL